MRDFAIVVCALAAATALPAGGAEFYVDPENGSDQGDGSSTQPWKSLQTVIDGRVETRGWKSLPYSAAGNQLVPVNAGAPIKKGDTIWLRSGNYGVLVIQGAYNEETITVRAAPSAVPRFARVLVRASQNWTLHGFTVSPYYGSTYDTSTIVTVEDHNWQGPSYDVVIDGFEIFSVPDESVWTTKDDWDQKAANAFIASSARVTVRNCRIRNVAYGIALSGQGSRAEYNTVDGFCGDGLRGLGDDQVFEYNLVKNARDVNDDHRDGFQSWSSGPGGVGTGVVKNVTLRGNVIIGYQSPSIPFAGTLQGIGCFDGFFEGWVVENNLVITDHWHGISLYGAINTRIVNNTVLDLNTTRPGPPWIMVTEHKNGSRSHGVLVRNNLATDFSVNGDDLVEDHNLEISDPSALFVDYLGRDLHLKAGSAAIGAGSSVGAPRIDIACIPRPQGDAVDLGAYEYAATTVQPDCSLGGSMVEPWTAPPRPGSGCGTPAGSAVLGLLALLGLAIRRRWRKRPHERDGQSLCHPAGGICHRVLYPPGEPHDAVEESICLGPNGS